MKKIVSLFLVMVMILAMSLIPAYAAQNLIEGEFLYEYKFVEEYIEPNAWVDEDIYIYNERYYHHVDENDPESEIDWVYVNAYSNMVMDWLVKTMVADRIFYDYNESIPFSFGDAIYDVKNECFVELGNGMLDKYDGLREMLEELNIGDKLGDADRDGKLTVMDATYIQMVSAGMCEYDAKDDIREFYALGDAVDYISDFDRDGERTVMDATAIQMKLAGIEA
ncbi:MAG: hypothetical protein IKB73_07225 [Ruminococcus sp.]|nr:hypothetical protein [Ruminococcus sp.]